MTRSFDNRVEVTFPIYCKNLQNQIIDTYNISWTDNVKARLINTDSQNIFVSNNKKKIDLKRKHSIIIIKIFIKNR